MAMSAPVTGTYGTTFGGVGTSGAIGQREDLTDIIARIDPTETPFFSNGTKATGKAILHEWQVQELIAPAQTPQPEGFDAAFDAPLETSRPGNYMHILARTGIIAGTLDVVDKAGRDRELAYQRTLKGLEIRRDLEATLLANNAKTGVDPREMGGFPTWITNGNWGAGSAPTGDGSDTATVTTPVAQTFAIHDGILEDCYNTGGEPRLIMFTPNAKRGFSALDGTGLPATSRYTRSTAAPTAFIGSVGVYVSDFGHMETAMNRFAGGSSVLGGALAYESIFYIDTRHYQLPALPGRSFLMEMLAKTGDAEKFQVLNESTLRVSAPKAHGFFGALPTV